MSDPLPIEFPKIGFAALPREQQREIASLGGQEAHRLGKAHRFTSEEAREAGRKGAEARRKKQLEKMELRSKGIV